jgi:hypothetical protein
MNKNNYKLYKSNTILNNREDLINVCFKTHDKIINNLKVSETTWSYAKYNFFQMSSCNVNCYHLFIELKKIIREFAGHTRPLWFQSWLNFHTPNQVLNWHNHDWPFHGYISIDSKKTKTVFEDYEIMNEDGNIYIGLGHKKHKVEVLENYDTPRITIGFDVTEGNVFHMNSFLPID